MPELWPRASTTIDAPLDEVWAIMLDTERYGEWNPFVVRAELDGPTAVGTPIVLHVRWARGGRTRSPERISVLEPPTTGPDGVRRATLAYDFEGWPAKLGLVRGRRYQRLTQEPGGATTYDTVEEFRGPLVRLTGPKRVEDGFRRHAAGLKARAEGGRTAG